MLPLILQRIRTTVKNITIILIIQKDRDIKHHFTDKEWIRTDFAVAQWKQETCPFSSIYQSYCLVP